MNQQKIKELKEQSYIQEVEYDIFRGHAPYYVNVFSEEKFAELVIQKCCEWIDGAPTTEEGTIILSKQFIIANLKNIFD